MNEDATKLLDLALVCMGLGEVNGLFPDLEQLHVSRSVFDGAVPMANNALSDLVTDEQEIFADVRARDLNGPLDVRLLSNELHNGEVIPAEDGFSLQRFRRVGPKEIRGQTNLITPNMVEWSRAFVSPKAGRLDSARSIWAETKPFRWSRIDNFPWGDRADELLTEFKVGDEHVTKAEVSINFAHGLAFTARYQWHVYLGAPGFPGLSIPTAPSGALEVFRLRDAEPSGRRAALRHWVRQHLRKLTSAEEEESSVVVREHLRGATNFTWEGLRCRITPSEFDLERSKRKAVSR